jgi:hypothetical protein
LVYESVAKDVLNRQGERKLCWITTHSGLLGKSKLLPPKRQSPKPPTDFLPGGRNGLIGSSRMVKKGKELHSGVEERLEVELTQGL